MKGTKMKKIKILAYCSAVLATLLFLVHFSSAIGLILIPDKNTKIIAHEIVFSVGMLIVCVIASCLIRKGKITFILIKRLLVSYGIFHIIVAFLLPRFADYVSGKIEVMYMPKFWLVDGDMIFRGILLLIFANILEKNFLE